MSDYIPQESQQEIDAYLTSIEAEQLKINDAYMQIGKAYYEDHPTDYAPEYESYYAAIRTSYETVIALRERILEAKGLRICPNCGCELPRSIRFCSECGTLMAEESAEELRCKRCGELLQEGAKFCTKCGQPVDSPAPIPAPVFDDREPVLEYIPEEPEATVSEIPPEIVEDIEEPPVEEPAPAPEVCPACGEPLIPGTAFCINCGARIGAAAEKPEPPAAASAPAFCTGCGNPLTPGMAFCTECGKPVAN